METGPPCCRACGGALDFTLADLGDLPLADSFLTATGLSLPEPRFPLRLLLCRACRLVQLDPAAEAPDIPTGYGAFASIQPERAAWARDFVASIRASARLAPEGAVIEIGGNDGYLLRHFRAAGHPVLNLEPATNLGFAARAAGVETRIGPFGLAQARTLRGQGRAADLLIANDVLPRQPDPGDVLAGIAHLLREDGAACLEFPALGGLLQSGRFEMTSHQRRFHFSLTSVLPLLRTHGLRAFDAESLAGEPERLRVWAGRADAGPHPESARLKALLAQEAAAGLDHDRPYAAFAPRIATARRKLTEFLAAAWSTGHRVAAFGASAAGAHFLNVCGVTGAGILFAADPSPFRQGLFLPGSHIPVRLPEALDEFRPDRLLLLPGTSAAPPSGWEGKSVSALSFLTA